MKFTKVEFLVHSPWPQRRPNTISRLQLIVLDHCLLSWPTSGNGLEVDKNLEDHRYVIQLV